MASVRQSHPPDKCLTEALAVDGITITHQVARRFVVWERLSDLLSGPFGRRMSRDVKVDDVTSIRNIRNGQPLEMARVELVAVAWAGERGRVRASATPGRVPAAMGTWSKSRFSWHLRLLGRIGHSKHGQRAHHLRGPVQEAIDGA